MLNKTIFVYNTDVNTKQFTKSLRHIPDNIRLKVIEELVNLGYLDEETFYSFSTNQIWKEVKKAFTDKSISNQAAYDVIRLCIKHGGYFVEEKT